MSISLLRQVASLKLPLNVSDHDQVDGLRAQMKAGLIAALQVRGEADPQRPGPPVVRVLAVTGDGRRLLEHCAATASGSHRPRPIARPDVGKG